MHEGCGLVRVDRCDDPLVLRESFDFVDVASRRVRLVLCDLLRHYEIAMPLYQCKRIGTKTEIINGQEVQIKWTGFFTRSRLVGKCGGMARSNAAFLEAHLQRAERFQEGHAWQGD